MSGFTTTGASILNDVESAPKSLLLWRATTHWLGGMGIVVLTVAVFPLLGIGGRALMEAEAPGPQVDKFTPRISDTAKILWLIYLGLTVLETLLLLLGGMNLFDAVTHSFATMATGGFSTRNANVGAYGSSYIDWVITVFMLIAGMNFGLHWKLLRGDIRPVLKDSELKTYLGIFISAVLIITLNLVGSGQYNGKAALRYAAFNASSILTTTGFANTDYLKWPYLSQTVLFSLMLVGGCTGSTGGGLKVGRIVTLFKMGLSEMRYLLNSRGIYGVFVDGRYLRKNIVYDIAAMVFLFLISVVVSTLVVASGGYDILTSLSATLACIGNIGPGFGLVGPVFTYSFFPAYIKSWLSFTMLLGRLEIYTVLVLFTRAFWRR
jgi:trk system potassium uptake protein TrkH